MSRQSLWSVIALGLLITSLSGAGVVAVFSDTAATGTNDVNSGDQPHLALQIAAGTVDPDTSGITCDQYVDDLQTGLITAQGFQADGPPLTAWVCLKNAFSAGLSLSVTASDLVDEDYACTVDEANYDASCQAPPNPLPPGYQFPQGELSSALRVRFDRWDVCSLNGPPDLGTTAELLADQSLGSLDAGQVTCIRVQVNYPGTSYSLKQAAQTDRATWRFLFNGHE